MYQSSYKLRKQKESRENVLGGVMVGLLTITVFIILKLI